LSQARTLPEPYPIEPGSPPDRPKPPSCTTGPVSSPDRHSKSLDDPRKQDEDDHLRKTHTSRDEEMQGAPSNKVGQNQAQANQSKGAEQAEQPDSESVPAEDSTSVVDQLDEATISQNEAVAAALASIELKSMPEAVTKAPAEEVADEVLAGRPATRKAKRLDAPNAQGQVEPTNRGAEHDEAESAPSTAAIDTVDKETPVAVDQFFAETTPEAAGEESALQEVSLIDATNEKATSEARPTNRKVTKATAVEPAQADNISLHGKPQEASVDGDDTATTALDTGSNKANPATRRRDTPSDRSTETTPKTKTEPAAEQALDTSDPVPADAENQTDVGAKAVKVSATDSVAALDTSSDNAGQNPPEQHSSQGKTQQPLDAGRDVAVDRATRQGAAHLRESDTSAPRSQLLSDVERLRFVQRVARAIGTSATADGGQMRLRLSPPELGSLRMEIVVRQGTVTAHVEAETTAARDVLLENLPALRERLAEQNIKLERFDVDLMRQSLDQTPQHAGDQDGDRAESGRRMQQAASRETKQTAERVTVQAPVIQDGHVNVVI